MYICLCNAITDARSSRPPNGAPARRTTSRRAWASGLGCGRCTSCAKDLLVDAIARISCGAGGLTPSLDGESR